MSNEKRRADILHDGHKVEGQQSLDRLQTVAAMETWDTQKWEDRQREARSENFLASSDEIYSEIDSAFNEIKRQNHVVEIHERSTEAPYDCIALNAVVHAPSLRHWGNSYHSPRNAETSRRGENAVIEIARKMARITAEGMRDSVGPEETVASITETLKAEFFDRDGTRVICAKRLDGPRGPIFLIQDGSHRVAAAKLVKFNKIFARTSSIADPMAHKKVWYESLALMPSDARTELLRSYDEVYPPTAEDNQQVASDLAHAETFLDEIYDDLDLHRRTLEERAQREAAKFRETKTKYDQANYVIKHLADRRRFERLHQEAGLEFLIANAPEHLWQDYEQRMDDNGFLVRKDGEDSYIRSTGYDVGDSYRLIMIMAAERYTAEHTDEASAILSGYNPDVKEAQ